MELFLARLTSSSRGMSRFMPPPPPPLVSYLPKLDEAGERQTNGRKEERKEKGKLDCRQRCAEGENVERRRRWPFLPPSRWNSGFSRTAVLCNGGSLAVVFWDGRFLYPLLA
jgi:hypothetical protein